MYVRSLHFVCIITLCLWRHFMKAIGCDLLFITLSFQGARDWWRSQSALLLITGPLHVLVMTPMLMGSALLLDWCSGLDGQMSFWSWPEMICPLSIRRGKGQGGGWPWVHRNEQMLRVHNNTQWDNALYS